MKCRIPLCEYIKARDYWPFCNECMRNTVRNIMQVEESWFPWQDPDETQRKRAVALVKWVCDNADGLVRAETVAMQIRKANLS